MGYWLNDSGEVTGNEFKIRIYYSVQKADRIGGSNIALHAGRGKWCRNEKRLFETGEPYAGGS